MEHARRNRWRLLLISAVVVLALAACGGGGDGSGSDDSEEGGETGGSTTTEVVVDAKDFAFSPSEIDVPAGAEVSVTLNNGDDAPHTFTSDELGADIEADAGGSGTGTFTAPASGSVEFVCSVHPDMKGTVTVEGSASTSNDSGGYGSDY